ncbi:MAG: MMPL family transporter, partial [Sedimenticolaceae bacterium]
MTRAATSNHPPHPLIRFSLDHPGWVIRFTTLLTLVLAMLAALPSIWPQTFAPLSALEVDTDPENMLSKDEAVRVFHNRMKRAFSIYDMVVVGVVNETHPSGVFNPQTLGNVHALTEFAKTLRWPDDSMPDGMGGVIEPDILAPSTLDNIEQDGLGAVRFDWLMPVPPATQQEAEAVRDRALKIPFLKGTVVSEDAKALSLYLPLSSKHLTFRTYTQLRDRIAALKGDERYYITGLPVAEDNFGVEMFIQMAISAPLSMLIIFLLMWFFFRKLSLVISPMIIAMVSVICTMGLLIVTGHTVHIMSSMIPIFIMPIAVLDSVHILSQFFDRYQETNDRRATIERVMRDLYKPMLYTSLTTSAGFASLALAPIPPVQVFGLFVAFGVMLAWLLTITFIPAYIMRMPEASLQGFGMPGGPGGPSRNPMMARLLHWLGDQTFHWARPILLLTVVGSAVSIYGITRIVINDNPIRWFAESHEIRVADAVLNAHFGGTYMAYLSLTPEDGSDMLERLAAWGAGQTAGGPELQQVLTDLQREAVGLARAGRNDSEALSALDELVQGRLMAAQGALGDAWEQAAEFIAAERLRLQVFKQPEVLAYLAGLQQALADTGSVGKSNSVVDIVKTVHRELLLGEEAQFRIPDSAAAVAQTLLVFQNSHRPQDLWHFVTPDFRRASIWVQMTSGDNLDMTRVVDSVE